MNRWLLYLFCGVLAAAPSVFGGADHSGVTPPKTAEKHLADDGHDHGAGHTADDGHNHAKAEKHTADDGHRHAPGESCSSGKAVAVPAKTDAHDHAKEEKHTADDGHDHSGEATHRKDDGHDHGAGEEEAPLVTLTPAQRKNVELAIGKAAPGTLSREIRLYGEVVADPARVAKLMPRLPGFVTAVSAQEGDVVKAGQVLAVLHSLKLGEMFAEYHSAEEAEELAKSEFDRNAKLFSSKSVAERDYLKAKREYADARILRHRLAAQFRALGIKPDEIQRLAHSDDESGCTDYQIKAPFDGVVLSRNISQGENFPEDNSQVLFTVGNFDKVFLDLNARPDDLPFLQLGKTLEVEAGEKMPMLSGRIIYIAPVADAATRMVKIRLELNNSGGVLRPGLFASGRFEAPLEGAPTLLVERDAVVLLKGESVVFVPDREGFGTQVVKTGRSSRTQLEILSGLKPGDEYVRKGAFDLKAVVLTSGSDPHAGHGH